MKRAKRRYQPEPLYVVLVHPDNSDAMRSLVGKRIKRVKRPWLIPGYLGTLDSGFKVTA